MMKVSVPIFVICVLLSGSQASLMDTLMTPVTWIMKGPSSTLAWLRSGAFRNNRTSKPESIVSDPLPLVDSDIRVFDNETHAFNDTDEVSLNPSEIDPLDNFNNVSALPDEDIVDHSGELRNLSSTVDDEVKFVLVNDSSSEITTMPSIPTTTTLRTIKMINNTWYPSTQPVLIVSAEPQDDEIKEMTIVPQVTTKKPEETTLAVELVNNPRKPRVHENKTESIESSSTIRSIPEMTTLRITEAPKTVKKTTKLPTTTTERPTTTPENPPVSLLESLANLTASHGDFRKGRQDYDSMPQPVYIPEIHGNEEKEIEEPQFEFHSELAKALGVHHNERKTTSRKVNNFL